MLEKNYKEKLLEVLKLILVWLLIKNGAKNLDDIILEKEKEDPQDEIEDLDLDLTEEEVVDLHQEESNFSIKAVKNIEDLIEDQDQDQIENHKESQDLLKDLDLDQKKNKDPNLADLNLKNKV